MKIWHEQGLLDREKLIYEEYLKQKKCEKIYWFTYGAGDMILSQQLKQEHKLHPMIEVFEMPNLFAIPKIGGYLYSLFLPFLYKKQLKESSILKTNQMDGSWSAVMCKYLYKKPLLLRTGYTLSIFSKKQKASKFKQFFSKKIESFAYNHADISTVASKQDQQYIIKEYNVPTEKLFVVTNYIDTSLFRQIPSEKHKTKIVFVGRLSNQKNLFNLIEALSNTDYELDIYGKGDLRLELENFAKLKNANVSFKGVINNNDLPIVLNQYNYYILASFYEGMPKTLLEAMACGCVCIGTNVEGISEVITHDHTGYLSQSTDSKSLKEVIDLAILSKTSKEIIENGINNIKDNYSLHSRVVLESKMIEKVINEF